MSTATKEKPGKRGTGPAKGMGAIGPIGPISPIAATAKPAKNGKPRPLVPCNDSRPAPQTVNLPVERIFPSRFQVRRDFAAEEIQAMADSILRDGLLVPITVRLRRGPLTDPDSFELIFGERRLRAVKLLKMAVVRAEILDRSDAEVRQMMLVEVLQRKDLNAIEEAAAFRAAIDAGDAPGPTELGRQLGLSQGHVSNRLRLLELPAEVRAKVISREIPATHARELVPVAKYPQVIKKVLANLQRDGGETGSLAEWQDCIGWALGRVGANIEVGTYDAKTGHHIPPPILSDEQRGALQIVSLLEDEHFAMNVRLWKTIQKEHKKEFLAKAAEKADGTTKATKTAKDGKDGKPKPLTAAQQKRLQEEEREKAADRARKLTAGLWAVAIDWRRYLIAKACREQQVDPSDITRLLVYFAASGDTWKTQADYRRRPKVLDTVLSAAGVRMPVRSGDWQKRPDVFAGMTAVADKDVLERTLGFLAELIWSATDGPVCAIPDADVLAIAGKLGIDLPAAWKKEALGPLTERWLKLRNKEGLVELGQQAAIWPTSGMDRSGLTKGVAVAKLLKSQKKLKPPAELLKPKKPKG